MALGQPAPPTTHTQTRLTDSSIGRKVDMGLALAAFASLSVHVFLRRRIGFRLMNPAAVITIALLCFFGPNIILIPLSWIVHFSILYDNWHSLFPLFGILFLCFAMFHRLRHWRLIRRGSQEWMTTSRGVSYFEFIPIPQHLVYRFVDPAAAFAVGWLVKNYIGDAWMGYWIMLAALCFLIVEQKTYTLQINHTLDMFDSVIAATAQTRLIQYYSQAKPARLSRSQTAGLPTGISSDVERLIAQRHAQAVREGKVTPDAAVLSPAELAAEAMAQAEASVISTMGVPLGAGASTAPGV